MLCIVDYSHGFILKKKKAKQNLVIIYTPYGEAYLVVNSSLLPLLLLLRQDLFSFICDVS